MFYTFVGNIRSFNFHAFADLNVQNLLNYVINFFSIVYQLVLSFKPVLRTTSNSPRFIVTYASQHLLPVIIRHIFEHYYTFCNYILNKS